MSAQLPTAPEPGAPTPFPDLEAITSRWLASDHEMITAALAHTANGVPGSAGFLRWYETDISVDRRPHSAASRNGSRQQRSRLD